MTRSLATVRIPLGRSTPPTWTLGVGALLPLVFVVAWVAAGTRQPPQYSPMRQTVSVMAGYAGTDRWIMNTALAVMTVCYALLAAGLTGLRPAPRVALLLAAICAAGILLSPQPATGTTLRHGAWSAVGEVIITAWPIIAVSAEGRVLPRGWGETAIAVSFVLVVWLVVELFAGHRLGLAERVVVTTQVCWPLVVAVLLRRRLRTAVA